MPKIVYVAHSGERHELDVPNGESVMRGALDNGIAGVDGDCGGVRACATCRVDVDPVWIDRVGRREAEGIEDDMLAYAPNLNECSRLSCQIIIADELDGLVVHMPSSQH